MVEAIVCGKLSHAIQGMEDVLTSSVFGLLQYAPHASGLLPFLACAADVETGEKPLSGVPVETTAAELEFWPWWHGRGCIPCQPDVVLRLLEANGRRRIVLVEAKYRSGKSSEADAALDRPYDQLAREWDNLAQYAAAECAEPTLVYLTGDIAPPVEDVRASKMDYDKTRSTSGRVPAFRCCWLSWRHLSRICCGADRKVFADLFAMLEHLDLRFYGGIRPIGPIAALSWRFAGSFKWPGLDFPAVKWRFQL